MNEDIIKEYGDFIAKMDNLLNEGVIFTKEEKDLLSTYNQQLQNIIFELLTK